jgi:hypothetical protein
MGRDVVLTRVVIGLLWLFILMTILSEKMTFGDPLYAISERIVGNSP